MQLPMARSTRSLRIEALDPRILYSLPPSYVADVKIDLSYDLDVEANGKTDPRSGPMASRVIPLLNNPSEYQLVPDGNYVPIGPAKVDDKVNYPDGSIRYESYNSLSFYDNKPGFLNTIWTLKSSVFTTPPGVVQGSSETVVDVQLTVQPNEKIPYGSAVLLQTIIPYETRDRYLCSRSIFDRECTQARTDSAVMVSARAEFLSADSGSPFFRQEPAAQRPFIFDIGNPWAIVEAGKPVTLRLSQSVSGMMVPEDEYRWAQFRFNVLTGREYPGTDLRPLSLKWNDSRVAEHGNQPWIDIEYEIRYEDADRSTELRVYWGDEFGNKIPDLDPIFAAPTKKNVGIHLQSMPLAHLSDEFAKPENAKRLVIVVDEPDSSGEDLVSEVFESNNSISVEIPCEAVLFGSIFRRESPPLAVRSPDAYMHAIFKPNFGLSLADAKSACNVHHFNFVQEVTSIPSEWKAYRASPVTIIDVNTLDQNLPKDTYYFPLELAETRAQMTANGLRFKDRFGLTRTVPETTLPLIDPEYREYSAIMFWNFDPNVNSEIGISGPSAPDGKQPFYDEMSDPSRIRSWQANENHQLNEFEFRDSPFFESKHLLETESIGLKTYLVGANESGEILKNWNGRKIGTDWNWKTNGRIVNVIDGLSINMLGGAPEDLDIQGGVFDVSFETPSGPRSPWHNANNGLDVNGDGVISPLDVLAIIDHINAFGTANLLVRGDAFPPDTDFIDTDDDFVVSPLDVLLIINAINAGGGSSPEGESAWDLFASHACPPIDPRPSTSAFHEVGVETSIERSKGIFEPAFSVPRQVDSAASRLLLAQVRPTTESKTSDSANDGEHHEWMDQLWASTLENGMHELWD